MVEESGGLGAEIVPREGHGPGEVNQPGGVVWIVPAPAVVHGQPHLQAVVTGGVSRGALAGRLPQPEDAVRGQGQNVHDSPSRLDAAQISDHGVPVQEVRKRALPLRVFLVD